MQPTPTLGQGDVIAAVVDVRVESAGRERTAVTAVVDAHGELLDCCGSTAPR